MAGAFTITTATNAVSLDPKTRQGSVIFTVANQTGRPLQARATVSSVAPTPTDWFTIAERAERQFPLGGSEAFTVAIAVPLEAAVGQHAFRLDIASTERPDVEWAHGPFVGFEIPPLPEPPPAEPPPGYVETALGAVLGFVAGYLLAQLTIAIVFLLGVAGADIAFVPFWIRVATSMLLPVLVAFGGALGIPTALRARAIDRPERWHTALAFGILSYAIGVIVSVILLRANLFNVDPIVHLVVLLIVGVVIALVSGLIARAIVRFRTFRHL
jgi:hypothetical protein